MRILKKQLVGSLCGLILVNGTAALSVENNFTSVFQGQGRGCWGKLYVREQAIEWNTPYSVCSKSAYTVIQSDLNSKTPRIAFALERKSKKCRYQVIELSFDPAYPDYWLASGYQSLKDFESRAALNDEMKLRTLTCGVQKVSQ